jgi:sulfur relay (sulfurtransferase) DsrC/TusE family protein
MRQTFRNQIASIILIYVQRFGRYEFSPAIRNSVKKSATDQKRWQISKNDLYKFEHNFTVFIILRHTVYIVRMCSRSVAIIEKKVKVDIFNNKQVTKLFRNSGTPVCY